MVKEGVCQLDFIFFILTAQKENRHKLHKKEAAHTKFFVELIVHLPTTLIEINP